MLKAYGFLKISRANTVLVLFVFSSAISFGQQDQLKPANKKYESFSYIDAISIYKKVADKGYRSVELFTRLGNAYYFNSEFTKAALWYEKLFSMGKELPPEYYYRYSQSLKSVGDYNKAADIMDLFVQKSATDARGIIYSKNEDYLNKISAISGRFIITDAGINSGSSDYGSALYGGYLVFATARDTAAFFSRKMKWNNQAFTNLYIAEITSDSTMLKPRKWKGSVNSIYNESSAIFSQDQKTMYFTRNNFNNGKKQKSGKHITLLKLYRSVYNGKEWSKPEELPFNSNEYSTAHPALGPDGKTLYFASDMPGSYGESDLYKVDIRDNGSFGKPQNLGKPINTEGKETFPFVSDDNMLYFASDGHPGLGGLDIFESEISKEGNYGVIHNIGEPINSKMDDFAILIDSRSRKGFFSSNRSGGKGSDDIYRFSEITKILCKETVSGTVADRITSRFISGVSVVLSGPDSKVIDSLVTDETGFYSFEVPCDKRHYIRFGRDDYETNEVSVMVPESQENSVVPVLLHERKKTFGIGDNVGTILGIHSIYFDLDKAVIRDDAAADLEKIVALMQQYPSLKLDIRSHTDSRQSSSYNLRLSEERAKATIKWLVGQGVNNNRLSGKGYGESQLLNKCSDGIECTEQEHQNNRRSEFIVTAL